MCIRDRRIEGGQGFTEAEIISGLVEALRLNSNSKDAKKRVSNSVFNLRLATCNSYLKWMCNECIARIASDDRRVDRIVTVKGLVHDWLSQSAAAQPVSQNPSEVRIDFTSHAFRHTINTMLDEGGLPELLQTDWFGRKNARDTKAYQHTSRAKRVLEVRQALLDGGANGLIQESLKKIPIEVHDAYLEARVRAVHDVGPGVCIHDFSQVPCERHLQCSAECEDFVWAKSDPGRIEEVKRQWAMAVVALETAENRARADRPVSYTHLDVYKRQPKCCLCRDHKGLQ